MNRATFNAMVVQYTVKEAAGNGAVSWDGGVRCVLPEVQIGGKATQETLTGCNRLELDGVTGVDEVTVAYDADTQIFTINGTKTTPGDLVLSRAASIIWDGATNFSMWREHIGGTVTLDNSVPRSRFLLWSVFTNDHTAYTARTHEYANVNSTILSNALGYGPGVSIPESPEGSGYRILLQCLGCSKESPIVFDNYQVRLMLVDADATTPTSYEPYTGGVPTPNPNWPATPVFSEGTTVESNGGGRAVAPVPLLAAVDGSCQSTWDPQTGKGLNWWHDAIELDGSEDWKIYTFSSRYEGFYVDAVMPENMVRNMYWCNQYRPIPAKEAVPYSFAHLWCGVNGSTLYCVAMRPVTFPFYDETLEDCGLANWKAHLAEHPLKLWVARNEPVEFQTDPQPLIQPKGSGAIIQTGGSIHGCPITAKYLTHS